MSEKLKPNFTPVPNVIFDKIMRGLKSGALKVLFAICRFTYGWQEHRIEGDRISLKQLADMTGMDRSNVHRAIKELGNLVIVTPGDPVKNQASKYRLNVGIPNVDLLLLGQQDPLSPGQRPVVRPVVTSATIQRKYSKESNSATRKKRDRADTDPRVKTLIAAFSDKYLARVGSHPVITQKDGASLKRLLTGGHDVPTIEAAMDRYFANEFYSKTGYDAAGFAKAFNRLNSAGAKKRHNYEDGAFPSL
jgi:phage replication O-like protein O